MKPGVTGLGGIFFKSEDPKNLTEWYKKHLNFQTDKHGYVSFAWIMDPEGNRIELWEPSDNANELFGAE